MYPWINYSQPVNWQHPLSRGLVGWWKVLPSWRGGNTWRDLCRKNDGTLTSMASDDWLGGGPTGSWGSLDFLAGSSQYVDMGDMGVFDAAVNMTICLWQKSPQSASYTQISKATHTTQRTFFQQTNSSGVLFMTWSASLTDANSYCQYSTVTADTWYHAVWVYDGSQSTDATKSKLYLDGDSKTLSFPGNAIPSSLTSSTAPVRVGGSSSQFFTGSIDDVILYDRSLSAGEVRALYQEARRGHPNMLSRIGPISYSDLSAVAAATPHNLALMGVGI